MRRIRIQGLPVSLPVINNQRIIYIQPHTIVRGYIKLVIVIDLRNKIARPAHREMVHRSFLTVAARSPMKVNALIDAHQGRSALQLVVVEILSLQPLWTTGSSLELRPH